MRNRAKILAARRNAQATVELRAHGGLDARIWSHVPARTDAPRTLADLHSETPASRALARDLKSHGFVFVGPTTAWALMQAIGLVDDHLVGCHRRGASGVQPGSVGELRRRGLSPDRAARAPCCRCHPRTQVGAGWPSSCRMARISPMWNQ